MALFFYFLVFLGGRGRADMNQQWTVTNNMSSFKILQHFIQDLKMSMLCYNIYKLHIAIHKLGKKKVNPMWIYTWKYI